MKFGRHKDLTVQQVLDFKHTRYLRWCYYCNSNISFTDDILEEIHVIYNGKKSYDKRISKPGKDEQIHESINTIMNGSGDDMQRIKQWARRKKVNKQDLNRKFHTTKYLSRKGNLMAKNHGH